MDRLHMPSNIEPEEDDSSWTDDDVRQSLARLAAKAELTPDEFRGRIHASAAEILLTPECITLDELEHITSPDSLPKKRRNHVRGCSACMDLLAVIEPVSARRGMFLEEIRLQTRSLHTHSVAWFLAFDGFSWKSAVAGATVCLIAAVPVTWAVTRSGPKSAIRYSPAVASTQAEPRASVTTSISNFVVAVPAPHVQLAKDARGPSGDTLDQLKSAVAAQSIEVGGQVAFLAPANEKKAVVELIESNGGKVVDSQPLTARDANSLITAYSSVAAMKCDAMVALAAALNVDGKGNADNGYDVTTGETKLAESCQKYTDISAKLAFIRALSTTLPRNKTGLISVTSTQTAEDTTNAFGALLGEHNVLVK